jgi:hypothetical protein
MTKGKGWEVNETTDDPVRYYPTFDGMIFWTVDQVRPRPNEKWISFNTKKECETFIKEYDND